MRNGFINYLKFFLVLLLQASVNTWIRYLITDVAVDISSFTPILFPISWSLPTLLSLLSVFVVVKICSMNFKLLFKTKILLVVLLYLIDLFHSVMFYTVMRTVWSGQVSYSKAAIDKPVQYYSV